MMLMVEGEQRGDPPQSSQVYLVFGVSLPCGGLLATSRFSTLLYMVSVGVKSGEPPLV
jgi:hypothetical protein